MASNPRNSELGMTHPEVTTKQPFTMHGNAIRRGLGLPLGRRNKWNYPTYPTKEHVQTPYGMHGLRRRSLGSTECQVFPYLVNKNGALDRFIGVDEFLRCLLGLGHHFFRWGHKVAFWVILKFNGRGARTG